MYRKGKRFIKNRKAVASVVGTMMAMMVFLSIFTLITTQYIPVWMQSNEITFIDNSIGGMISLDHALTMEAISNTTQITERTPFRMESADVPVLSPPTAGVLTFNPLNGLFYVSFQVPTSSTSSGPSGFTTFNLGTYNPGSPSTNYGGGYGGSVDYYVPARYVQPERIVYEGSAIIVSESSAMVVKVSPEFKIMTYTVSGTTYYELYLGIYGLYGQPATGSGPGIQSIYTTLLGEQQYKENYGTNLESTTINILTPYPTAWINYLNGYLSIHDPGSYSVSNPPSAGPPGSNEFLVTVTITGLSAVNIVVATYGFSIYSGSSL